MWTRIICLKNLHDRNSKYWNNIDSEEAKKLYDNFIYLIKTEVTRKHCLTLSKYYMKFLGISSFKDLIDEKTKSQKIIESDIKEYLVYLRNQKKII